MRASTLAHISTVTLLTAAVTGLAPEPKDNLEELVSSLYGTLKALFDERYPGLR